MVRSLRNHPAHESDACLSLSPVTWGTSLTLSKPQFSITHQFFLSLSFLSYKMAMFLPTPLGWR